MHFAISITQKLRKLVRSLNQKTHREQHELFITEGLKLCQEVNKSDFEVELIVVRDSANAEVIELCENYADQGVPIYNAAKHQFDQMATTKSPQGIVGVVNQMDLDLSPGENFIVLDGVNDPGNLGTIIRTAEWFGYKQVILCNDCADHYNPKAVRSSMGSVFRVAVRKTDDVMGLIGDNFPNQTLYGATLDSEKALRDLKIKSKYGIIFGSESHGISEVLLNNLGQNFTIRGVGSADSLNVAIAAGVTFNHFALNS
jgi:RNA methyltransferase, TrmH family